jgi:anthranilate phosphoribosyltransferase
MGIPLDVPPPRQKDVLRQAGIAFLFAPAHHPALKHAAQARRELGTRTVFNVLGPLANPARATHQLVGVYDDSLRRLVAEALAGLGTKRAWVVRGEDGLDEISPCALTRVTEIDADGRLRERTVAPEDFGVDRVARTALAGGDAEHNARELSAILNGDSHPVREAVVLNAAAALHVATGENTKACAAKARRAIEIGLAREALQKWKRVALSAKESHGSPR